MYCLQASQFRFALEALFYSFPFNITLLEAILNIWQAHGAILRAPLVLRRFLQNFCLITR